jgi:hypothetical protein
MGDKIQAMGLPLPDAGLPLHLGSTPRATRSHGTATQARAVSRGYIPRGSADRRFAPRFEKAQRLRPQNRTFVTRFAPGLNATNARHQTLGAVHTKTGLRPTPAEKVGISGATNPLKQFFDLSRICYFAVTCGIFGVQKVPISRWTEASANHSLGPNSLLTGKFTGNFANLTG